LGKEVEGYIAGINTDDNTFSQSWTAGIQEHNPITEPTYDRDGKYEVRVSYVTPDLEHEEVILTFDYSNTVAAAPTAPATTPMEEVSPATTNSAPTPFTDDSGFSVLLPEGWVGEDFDNINPSSQSAESQLGYGILTAFCPQEQVSPQVGGCGSNCQSAEDVVYVFRYKDLRSRPEFASLPSDYKITAEDMMAYELGKTSPLVEYSNVEIVLSEDVSIRSGSIPAKLTLATYDAETSSGRQVQIASYRVHFVIEDMMTGKVHGFSLSWERPLILIPDAIEEGIADDFGAIAGSIFLTGLPILTQEISGQSDKALWPQQQQHLS
jgi:hypothetical protein